MVIVGGVGKILKLNSRATINGGGDGKMP